MRTGVFESAAEKILHDIVENSAAFQKSIANYAARKDASIRAVGGKIAEIDKRLADLVLEKGKLDDRLSFLLESNNMELARSFRDEYEKQFSALKNEERELENRKGQLQLLQKQIREAQAIPKDSELECVNTAINCVKKKDAIALKSAYKQLFERIVVIHPCSRCSV